MISNQAKIIKKRYAKSVADIINDANRFNND